MTEAIAELEGLVDNLDADEGGDAVVAVAVEGVALDTICPPKPILSFRCIPITRRMGGGMRRRDRAEEG